MTTQPTIPTWLPADLRNRYVAKAPKGSTAVCGPFVRSEAWMLKKQAAELTGSFVIAPMQHGVGTFRLSGK